ncbi:MAG: pseudaminic acid synthase [Candidatus Gastranaerophilaceae bacterium]|jgi:N-acetylneuraminate synthase
MKIANNTIGKEYKPFIIAEMSGNHNQSIERALKIIEVAAESGVDALKLQTYTPDTMTLDLSDREFFIEDEDSLWKGESLYNLYQKAYTPWEWHKPIFDKCRELGIIGFSSPFDFTSVDFLEELNVPCYKIASFENIDLPLIKKVAKTGKPVIMSTGMANLAELYEAVKTLKENGCENIVLLKCTSTYPATPENTNILTIPHMKTLFPDCEIGLSDHTLGIGTSIAGVTLGATIIEKHFTLSRAEGGVDADFSMEPQEMKQLVVETERAWQSLGKVSYDLSEKEKASLKFRRSLYISKDINKGEVLTENNLRSIRPGYGLPPKYYETLLGKKVFKNIKKGTPTSWDFIRENDYE